jgi:hypothetical protein
MTTYRERSHMTTYRERLKAGHHTASDPVATTTTTTTIVTPAPGQTVDNEATKAELQAALTQRGLPTTGNKAELTERLAGAE